MKSRSNPERRSVLKWLMGLGIFGWLGSVLYPIARFIVPPSIPEANVSSMSVGLKNDFPVGEGTIFQFGQDPGILIRLGDDDFKAFAATCTHLSCIVQYRPDLAHIWCACHNGRFDLTGRNVAGPPPRPLEAYDVYLKGEEVWVARKG